MTRLLNALGETPEQEIARLKRESRQLANALADLKSEVETMGTTYNPILEVWAGQLMKYLRPINDLVTLVRARK